jgi:Spy/CpxP family protein refolding chaperone
MAILGLLVAAIWMIPSTATAGKGRLFSGNGGFGPGPGELTMFMKLSLSDIQKVAIAEILSKYREEMEEKMDALVTARELVYEATHGVTFVEEDIRLVCQETCPFHEELAVLRAKVRAEIMAVLDSEQIEELMALETQRRDTMKERFESKASRLDAWLETILSAE